MILEDNTKQPLTADASLYNGQPTDTGSSCPSTKLTSCTSSVSDNVRDKMILQYKKYLKQNAYADDYYKKRCRSKTEENI